MAPWHLPLVDYEPADGPSLFEQWDAGVGTATSAPLAVFDRDYRSRVVEILEPYRRGGLRLVSIGAGNGFVEAELQSAGWDVLATDPALSALRLCAAKGLSTAAFRLLEDGDVGTFDVIYCDGVMGHLWKPRVRSAEAWSAVARVGRSRAICLASNDLSDDDEQESFGVRAAPDASFYRPPAGWFAADAISNGRWSIDAQHLYHYARSGRPRRREIVVARLLLHERIEAEERS